MPDWSVKPSLLMRRDKRIKQMAEAHSGALAESEQRFHRVFEESPLGILLADNDSQRIVQANPAFCRMLGADAEQIIGRTIAGLAHVDDREVAATMPSAAGLGRIMASRFATSHEAGAIAWASVRLTRLSALDGRPALMLALTEDVTREKRVEAELRQAQKMEAIGQLTGGIAHDFNNLLGVIIGNVEFLIDTVRDAEQADLGKEILNSALSGADLTRRLLAFARRQTLQPRRIDLNAYLPNHIAILRRLLGESDPDHRRRWRTIFGRPGRIPRRWATPCSIWRSMRATRCRMAARSRSRRPTSHLAAGEQDERGDSRATTSCCR